MRTRLALFLEHRSIAAIDVAAVLARFGWLLSWKWRHHLRTCFLLCIFPGPNDPPTIAEVLAGPGDDGPWEFYSERSGEGGI